MMKEAILSIAIFASFLVNVVIAEPNLGAENVCNKTEYKPKDRIVRKPVVYKIEVDSICGFLPCKKVITETKTDVSRETYFEKVSKRECCDGYAETPERTCGPICLNPCQNGKCVKPNRCECNPRPLESSPGYAGPTCNRFVCSAINRWGQHCDKECQCSDTAFCDARNGKCVCRPGWRGANCTEECDSKSGCDDFILPPIFEPEVNIIRLDDNTSGRMSAALSMETASHENDADEKKAFSKMLMTHMQINLILMLATTCLILAVFLYKKKLNELKDQIYYAAYPRSSDSQNPSSANYSSVYSANSTIRARPRMPTPDEASFLGKNLSFDLATRNAINDKDNHHLTLNLTSANEFVTNSKTEKHLAGSKKESGQNIYSDIDSSTDNISTDQSFGPAKQTPIFIDNLLHAQEEHVYQVPRSPAKKVETRNFDSDQIYEEIVPSPSTKLESPK